MKKRLLLKTVLFFFLAFIEREVSFAQDSAKYYFVNGIGIKSGITISHLVMKNSPTPTYNIKTDNIYTPYFALTTEFFHHKNFRISTDIDFIQKGGKIEEIKRYYPNGTSEVETINAKTKLNSISWNIVSMGMLNINKFSPFIFVGPRIDYFHYRNSGDPIFYSNNRRLHFGMISGLGINYRINKKNILSLEATKYFNFVPYYESYSLDPPCSTCDMGYLRILGKLDDRTFVISVGYKYLLNNK